MADEAGVMGPVGYLVVEFPGSKMTGEGLPVLVDLVERGLIRIIDLTFVTKDEDGTVRGATLADLDGDGTTDLAVFEGAASGVLGAEEVDESGAILAPGSSGAVLLYENVWAAPLTAAIRRGGGELVAAGFIPQDSLVAALDASDAN